MFGIGRRTDTQIRNDVLNELIWDASVTANCIEVSADGGIVTLSGSVPHYGERAQAEKAAQRIKGVKAVADEMEVRLRNAGDRTDAEIASAALAAMKWNYSVPDNLKVSVDAGVVTLRGECDWDFERSAAFSAVSNITGVLGIKNEISLRSAGQAAHVKSDIEDALRRTAETETNKIGVLVNGNSVTLSGQVNSHSELEDAALAAWNAPGVMEVINNLTVIH